MNTQNLIGRLLALNLLAFSAVLYADGPTSTPSDPWISYSYLYFGNNIGNTSSSKLESVNYKGTAPGEWGIGIGRYVTDTISLEGALEYWGERFERKDGTVLPGTKNSIIQVTNMGLSASAVYNYTRHSFHVHLGAGAGYFSTEVLVTDPDSGLLTKNNTPSDKWFPEYHAGLGIDYCVGKEVWIGIEVKHRILYADFGPYTDGRTNVGGTFLLFAVTFL